MARKPGRRAAKPGRRAAPARPTRSRTTGEQPKTEPVSDDKPKQPRQSLAQRSIWLAVFAVFIAAGLTIYFAYSLNPKVANSDNCPAIRRSDDLSHLSERGASGSSAQIARWKACDPTVVKRAQSAVRSDFALIAVVGVGLILAGWRARQHRRWRLAAYFGWLFTAGYIHFDILENIWLLRLLRTNPPEVNVWLRWVSALKWGCVAAALPIAVVAIALAAAGSVDRPEVSRLGDRVGRFRRRWARRIRETPGGKAIEPETPPAGGEDLAICCSGGGIRSAAFNLGALQALEVSPGNELQNARWLSCVSGGSYIAAAWVTARRNEADAWSRRSFEEDHLRRHASYLAPGIPGKLWALTRFVLGFGVNLLVVVLALFVVFLPSGWGIGKAERPRPVRAGVVSLPFGGCLSLDDQTIAVVRPGSRVRLAETRGVRLKPGERIGAATSSEALTGSVTITQGKKQVGNATVVGVGDASTDVTTNDAQRAGGSVSIGEAGAGSAKPPDPKCPGGKPPPSAPPRTGSVVTDNLRVDKSAEVVLDTTRGLRVHVVEARACFDGKAQGTGVPCTDEASVILTTGTDAVLKEAPLALLKPSAKSIVVRRVVSEGGADKTTDIYILHGACGEHACKELGPNRVLKLVTLLTLGFGILLGMVLVTVRARAEILPGLERWVRSVLWLGVGFAAAFYGFPRLVVLAEQGRWWIGDRLPEAAGTGTGALFLTLLAQLWAFGAGSERAKAVGRVAAFAKKLGPRLRAALLRFAGAVIGPLLVVITAVAFASSGAQHGFEPGGVKLLIFGLGVLIAFACGGDLNEWSLHPFYRERLRSAFAVNRPGSPEPMRSEPLSELAQQKAGSQRQPELLVCAAANIADDRITAPGRPVVSWVFSPERVGSEAIERATGRPGTIESDDLCSDPRWGHMAETWTAVAVSGAAISPAMGKMTLAERFLLALGNVRLGLWYPNPRFWSAERDEETDIDKNWYALHHPRPWYLAKEALGFHKLHDPWIYVTDGGHYENLGLVELLRRGAQEIFCFDASGDRPDTFGTIADAMRIAREELDVEVSLRPGKKMKPNEDGISPVGVWAGSIQYPPQTDPKGKSGWIVVAKLSVPNTAPFDVVDLARTLPSFPNHPTADQLYTDQKFEAYRALGHHLGEEAAELADLIRAKTGPGKPIKDVVKAAIDEYCASVAPDEEPDLTIAGSIDIA